MKQQNFNIVDDLKGKSLSNGPRKPRILVAPLDWGLGHATRCIPVIYELILLDCEVWLAAEGQQEALLKEEFPQLSFLSLTGYRVRYGRSVTGMILTLFAQSGKILRAIKHEHKWLEQMMNEYHFDAVLSDNRFGLFHAGAHCVFITHQLHIKSSLGKGSEILLRKRNYGYINRFAECWVPDIEGGNNLAGELSHPAKKPAIPIHYLGLLSRFNKTGDDEKKGHLLVILSGPEPQRSIFEDNIIRDIARYNGTATIVRGLPGSHTIIPSTGSIKVYNHLPAEELNKEMNRAEYVIGRSGYSTIMDIARLQKKSILVPTPGQTEQEYLAKYLMEKKIAISFSQKTFTLPAALQSASSFQYHIPGVREDNLQPILTRLVQSLQKK